MIGAMRSKNNSTLLYIIMGLVALGLVGIGAAGVGGGRLRSIGEVGDEKIHVATYVTARQNAIARISQQFGRQITAAEADQFGLSTKMAD